MTRLIHVKILSCHMKILKTIENTVLNYYCFVFLITKILTQPEINIVLHLHVFVYRCAGKN